MGLLTQSVKVFMAGLLGLGWAGSFVSSTIALPLFDLARQPAIARSTPQVATVSIRQLPPEVKATVERIRRGGPFPYRKDGTTFGNREKRLPVKAAGYYKEYTVPTPGAKTRGARRLVVGGANEIYYYTGDHYRSFVKVKF